jgi:hypothetical protein
MTIPGQRTSGVTVTDPAGDRGPSGEVKAPIAVFLLDDHEIVRRGVRDLLEAEPDITVVGEAGTAASALARIPALQAGRGGAGRPAP